jgi:hypothetical protein
MLKSIVKKRLSPNRKALIAIWRLILIVAILCFVFPVKTNLIRYGTVVGFVLSWLGAIILWRRYTPIVIVGALVAIATGFVAFTPGRPIDPTMLREADIRELQDYEGVRYIWGGESVLGIDCSGLMRRGLIDAYLVVGCRTLNPAAFREAFAIYWRDCSAEEIGEGYGGKAVFIAKTKAISQCPPTLLAPGDMAVIDSPSHIMAYLGGGIWIEADPNPMQVKKIRYSDPSEIWLTSPARIMRWRCLENPSHAAL